METSAESSMYAPNLVRPASAPESMVAAVPTNTAWKMKKTAFQGSSTLSTKSENPKSPHCDAPNIRPNPMNQNPSTEITKSPRFFIATLIEFFALAMPLSRHMNPACIKKTIAAAISTHK